MNKLKEIRKVLDPITNEMKYEISNVILYSEPSELVNIRFTNIKRKDIRLLITFSILENGKKVYRYLNIENESNSNNMPTMKHSIANYNQVLSIIYSLIDKYEINIIAAGLLLNELNKDVNEIVSDNIKFSRNNIQFKHIIFSLGYSEDINLITIKLTDISQRFNFFIKIEENNNKLTLREYRRNSEVTNLSKIINLIQLSL